MLEMSRTNAQFHRLFEEYGLGEHLESEGGVGLTTPKLHTLLQRLLRRSPELRDTEGNFVSDGLVREAASHLSNPPRIPRNSNGARGAFRNGHGRPPCATALLSMDGR